MAIYLVQTLIKYSCSPSTRSTKPLDDLFDDDEERKEVQSVPSSCEKSTIGAYTILDLANKAASDYYLNLTTQDLSNRGEEGVKKNELKMAARRELEELEDEGKLLEKSSEFEAEGDEIEREEIAVDAEGSSMKGKGKEKERAPGRKGVFTIWVEKVHVTGPRN